MLENGHSYLGRLFQDPLGRCLTSRTTHLQSRVGRVIYHRRRVLIVLRRSSEIAYIARLLREISGTRIIPLIWSSAQFVRGVGRIRRLKTSLDYRASTLTLTSQGKCQNTIR